MANVPSNDCPFNDWRLIIILNQSAQKRRYAQMNIPFEHLMLFIAAKFLSILTIQSIQRSDSISPLSPLLCMKLLFNPLLCGESCSLWGHKLWPHRISWTLFRAKSLRCHPTRNTSGIGGCGNSCVRERPKQILWMHALAIFSLFHFYLVRADECRIGG